ncbi:hypothetical protein VCRA2128O305_380012 [Vibrio crassostreae]|nr:hypothetical protein VCRA2118O239_110002 [Vibrio crassostreae]CAK1948406.1 hypothetical protein VCRA2110O181_240052 [Vibrio crassostreae]CAK1958332.1 hypothetical protein VCRA2111O320_260006 [Vibrio crassostreae]CAK1958783.1 hypothetical protein VCRA2113O220_250022 [Vibrio crassostreae]CAK1963625.1 hypothetical protein VCRA2112O187_280020 [Vibrio crassostreae]
MDSIHHVNVITPWEIELLEFQYFFSWQTVEVELPVGYVVVENMLRFDPI